MTRGESAIKRAEDRLNDKRIKLVEYKIQIDRQDSLYTAGEALIETFGIVEKQSKSDLIKLEKKYKADIKSSSKAKKMKNNSVAVVAQKDYDEITSEYNVALNELKDKIKVAEHGIINGERMTERANKKLDMLADKLKLAEKAYKAADKDLQEKRNGK